MCVRRNSSPGQSHGFCALAFLNTLGEQTYEGMASCDTPLSRVLRRHTVFHHWLVQGYRRCVSYPPYRDHRLLSMRSSYPSLPSFRQLENRPTIKRRLGRNEEFLIDSKTDHASLNGENGLRDGFTSAHARTKLPA